MKKNMKKIMALLLTVTLSLGLYGCGSKNDKTESGTSTAAESDTVSNQARMISIRIRRSTESF